MGKRRKRRSWSGDEKREICQQTTEPGVSVAQAAHRYAMNAKMIHTWLKDPRFVPVEEDVVDDAVFLPVEISTPVSVNSVDISLTDGRRFLIEGPTALAAVVSPV